MSELALNQKARLANLLTNTEKHGKKAKPIVELTLEFSDVPADEVATLLMGSSPAEFRAAFWGEDGNPRFMNLGKQAIDRLPVKNGYDITAFGCKTEPASLVKDWTFVPTGGHRCLLTCKVRVVDPGKEFEYRAFKHQEADVPSVTLQPLQGELEGV